MLPLGKRNAKQSNPITVAPPLTSAAAIRDDADDAARSLCVCVCAGPPTYDEVSSCVREQTNDRVCCVGERTRVVVVVVVVD